MFLLLYSIAICLSACSPATEITGSRKSLNEGTEQISSVMVTALTNKTNARQTVENDLARASEKGLQSFYRRQRSNCLTK
jgi:hypothetical protein